MAYTKQLQYETIRSIDSATFSGSFQALGTPLLHPATIVRLVNNSSVLVTISVDGTSTVDVAPANSFWLYDVTSNTPSSGDDAIFIPQGRQYFVSGTASTGLVYLVVQYIVQV
jgi:hypothetical protein